MQPTDNQDQHEEDSGCRPWSLDLFPTDDPCGCHERPGPQSPSRQRPPRARPKNDDCCEQILALLGQPERSRRRPRKPKQPVKTKTYNLCADGIGKTAVVPVLMLFLRRFKDGVAPVNAYEKRIQDYLNGVSAAAMDALSAGLAAYEAVPTPLKECIFETRFDGCDSPDVLDPSFIGRVILQEAAERGVQTLYDLPAGPRVPGQVRPYERTFPKPPDATSPPPPLVGPWPWICAVSPGEDNNRWYRNRDVTVPGNLPLSAFTFEDRYEFGHQCTPVPDPNDPKKFTLNCDFEKPPPAAPGALAAPFCHGNERYNYQRAGQPTICFALPKATPGQSVALRGLNFFAKTCRVRLFRLGGGFPDQFFDVQPIGDPDTPLTRDGKVVATCEVRDIIAFDIPTKITQGVNEVPVPPGVYAVEVIVPNVVGYAPTPGVAPAEFVSNTVWLDMQPSPDIGYRLWTNEAFCIEETDGLGSDEPWFQAFAAKFVAGATTTQNVFAQSTQTIMRTDDVDSGEWITYSAPDLFNGKLRPGEVCAISVLGLEVDSESAAEKQIRDFGAAYADYWNSFWTATAVGTDIGLVYFLIKQGVSTTVSLIVGIALLAAVALIGVLHAIWAPADPIAFDIIVLDAVGMYWKTDLAAPIPPPSTRSFGDLSLAVQARPKDPKPGGGMSATYSEDHYYRSEDEDSRYRLVYRIERI
jgi:hypothetical protein